MAIIWTAYHGGPTNDVPGTLDNVMLNYNFFAANTTRAMVSYLTFAVEFRGSIVLDSGGNPKSGVVHSIKVFNGPTLIARATGYDLDVKDLNAAFASAHNADLDPFHALLFEPSFVFDGSPENDDFAGGKGESTLFGNAGADSLYGFAGKDRLVGGAGPDILDGGRSNDDLEGGKGRDWLLGGPGNDLMHGGPGADYFAFLQSPGAKNADEILDFVTGKDLMLLDSSRFGVLGASVETGEFRRGAAAQDPSDHLIYVKQSGHLYYDVDGVGGQSQVLFARLDPFLHLSASDFGILV